MKRRCCTPNVGASALYQELFTIMFGKLPHVNGWGKERVHKPPHEESSQQGVLRARSHRKSERTGPSSQIPNTGISKCLRTTYYVERESQIWDRLLFWNHSNSLHVAMNSMPLKMQPVHYRPHSSFFECYPLWTATDCSNTRLRIGRWNTIHSFMVDINWLTYRKTASTSRCHHK